MCAFQFVIYVHCQYEKLSSWTGSSFVHTFQFLVRVPVISPYSEYCEGLVS